MKKSNYFKLNTILGQYSSYFCTKFQVDTKNLKEVIQEKHPEDFPCDL